MTYFGYSNSAVVIAIVIVIILISIAYYYYNGKTISKSESKECQIPQPDPPFDLKALITYPQDGSGRNHIKLTWNATGDVDYKVYRYTSDPMKGGEPMQIIEVKGAENMKYIFENVDQSSNWFRVRSQKDCAISDFSNVSHIVIDCEIDVDYDDFNFSFHKDETTGNGILKWNKIPKVQKYGIIVVYPYYHVHTMISFSHSSERYQYEMNFADDVDAILFCVINECGQSEPFIAYSK